MKSNKKQAIFVTSLIVLLVLALGYISLGMYASWNQANQLNSAQYGYNQAILSVAEQAATCQQVPLIVGNQTINIIAIECLQQAAAPAQTEEIQ